MPNLILMEKYHNNNNNQSLDEYNQSVTTKESLRSLAQGWSHFFQFLCDFCDFCTSFDADCKQKQTEDEADSM